MRLFAVSLISAMLGAQEHFTEAKFQVAGNELRYLYATGSGPLLLILPGSTDEPSVRKLFSQWYPVAAARGWSSAMPFVAGVSDGAVKAVELVVADAKKGMPKIDETRVYLAGLGPGGADVFYTLSRVPDLWAAALAIQGSPGQAIQSYKLYGANTQAAPLLWVAPAAEVETFRQKLSKAEFNFETRAEAGAGVFEWLAAHQRALFPPTVDCETGSPAFARCYWIEMTKFDPKKRNDVLKSTRVMPGSGASLAFGPFG